MSSFNETDANRITRNYLDLFFGESPKEILKLFSENAIITVHDLSFPKENLSLFQKSAKELPAWLEKRTEKEMILRTRNLEELCFGDDMDSQFSFLAAGKKFTAGSKGNRISTPGLSISENGIRFDSLTTFNDEFVDASDKNHFMTSNEIESQLVFLMNKDESLIEVATHVIVRLNSIPMDLNKTDYRLFL